MNALQSVMRSAGLTAGRAAGGSLLLAYLTAIAGAQIPSYTVIDLGTLGGPGAAARAVNNRSVVTGLSAVGSHQHAFRWKEATPGAPPGTPPMTDLGLLPATSDSDGKNIAQDGSVAGISDSYPVLWSAPGLTKLPGIAADDRGQAQGSNGAVMVGYITRLVPGSFFTGARAVKWMRGDGKQLLATELHMVDATFSQATDINASGQISGWANTPPFFGEQHAMIWSGAGTSDLHTGFATKTRSLAFAINASGTIAGTAFTTSVSSDPIPVRASAAGGMIALPLPVGTSRGQATDINAAGEVVGFGDPGNVAMLWLADTTPVVLQSRIPAGSGWTLQIAYSINDHGEIAGVGIFSGQTRAFLLRPTTYHPCAGLETALLDPANPEPEPNPGYPLLTNGEITTDKNKLAAYGQPAVGLVADGTTRLVLRCTTSDPGTVTVSFPGPGDGVPPATGSAAQDGRVGPPGAKPSGALVTAPTTNIGGKNVAFAVYLAPEELPAEDNGESTRILHLKVRFDGPAGCDPISDYVAIRVDRPPVVVMHGLWSNMNEAFGGFRSGVKAQIKGLWIAGPNYPNAAHLADNKTRLSNQIDWFRGELRREKMAMTQADVFGHSMGGLLSRLWAGEPVSHNRTNYNEGDINRLVTIDSVHCGSPIADAIWLFRSSLDPVIRANLDNLIAQIGTPPDTGALEDFRVFGPAIADLTSRFTDARAHTIAGDYSVPIELCSPAFAAAEPLLAPFFCTLKEFGLNVTVNIPTHSDLLVGVDSQLGGLVAPATDKHNHAHSGAANQPAVISDCVGLLRTRPSSPFFAEGFPFGCDALPIAPPTGPVPTLRTSGGVLISDPPPGATAPPGGIMAVGATTDPGSGMTEVLFSLPGAMAQVTAPPFTTSLTIPSGAFGTITLQVIGKHSDGSLSFAERTLTVTTATALSALTADPPAIGIFSRGHRERARIDGTFADSVVRDLTAASTGTTYLSSNTGVVTVDANGWLTPVAGGSATVTATNGSRSALIAVTVAFVAECDLALTGPGATLVMFTGESIELAFTAENHGPDLARPADVFVSGPPAVSLTGTAGSAGAWNNNAAPAWSVAALAAADSVTLSVEMEALTPGAGTVSATITGTGRDFVAENNALSIPVRVFAEPQFAFGAGGGAVHFTTEAGVLYTLESSPDLVPAHWTTVTTVSGDGTEKSLPLPPAAALRLFLRLRLTAP